MLSRRGFLGAFAAGAMSGAARRPNVLLIAVDDMNDWIGCLRGHPAVRTPNLDRLAQRGVLFANAHCASPLCNPSRTALFTGMRPDTTGVYGNEQFWRPALPGARPLSTSPLPTRYWYRPAGKWLRVTTATPSAT